MTITDPSGIPYSAKVNLLSKMSHIPTGFSALTVAGSSFFGMIVLPASIGTCTYLRIISASIGTCTYLRIISQDQKIRFRLKARLSVRSVKKDWTSDDLHNEGLASSVGDFRLWLDFLASI